MNRWRFLESNSLSLLFLVTIIVPGVTRGDVSREGHAHRLTHSPSHLHLWHERTPTLSPEQPPPFLLFTSPSRHPHTHPSTAPALNAWKSNDVVDLARGNQVHLLGRTCTLVKRERGVEATAAQSHATRNVLFCSVVFLFFSFCLPDTNLDWSQYPPTLEDEEGAHSLIRSVVRSVIHTHARALAFFAPLSNTNTNTKHWCKML